MTQSLLLLMIFIWLISTLCPPPLSLPLRWLYSPELRRSSLNASITQTSRYSDHLSSAWFWGSAVWSLMSHWMFCALTGPCCLFYHDPHCSFLISRGQMARGGGSAFFSNGTNLKFKFRFKCWCKCVLPPQELYQKLTDYDIRFYMYELLKVSLFFHFLKCSI